MSAHDPPEMIVQHLILTRFAVKTKGSGFSDAFPLGWIETRFSLFERFCLPTIQSQTHGNFRWLLLVHDDFGDEHKERLTAYDPRIEVVQTRNAGLAQHVDAGVDVVISTRLDSDDGLNREAVGHLASVGEDFYAQDRKVLLHNFPRGCKLDAKAGTAYLAWKPNSAFLTLFERPEYGPVRGALSGNHSHFLKEVPAVQDDALCAWLMVIHGGNVFNRIDQQDLLAPAGKLSQWFNIADDPTAGGDRVSNPQEA